MEHIPFTLEDSLVSPFGALLLLAVITAILGFLLSSFFGKRLGFGPLGVVIAVFMAVVATFAFSPYQAYQATARDAFNEAYGLELTEPQFAELQYPLQVPEESNKIFGATDAVTSTDSGLAVTRVHLIFKEGKFELAHEDDGDFKPLPTKQ